LPEKKLAIEFNGTYWHSTECGKDRWYHLNKTLRCKEKGIRLIHIFENEWKENRELCEKTIINNINEFIPKSEIIDLSKYVPMNWKNYSFIKPQLLKTSNYFVYNCGYLHI